MANALHVYIVNPDHEVLVEHIFYGDTLEECRQVKAEHLESCEYFAAAEREGRTDEWHERIDDDERPSVDSDDDDGDDDYEP